MNAAAGAAINQPGSACLANAAQAIAAAIRKISSRRLPTRICSRSCCAAEARLAANRSAYSESGFTIDQRTVIRRRLASSSGFFSAAEKRELAADEPSAAEAATKE